MIDGSSGLQGIQKGMTQMRQQAHTVATENAGSRQSNTAMVEMSASQRHVEANVKTLQAEDRMIGSLLDVRA
ncbi:MULTISPECIES: flagellar basal body rod C-terminal domain-containing protein [Thioalkalivibrio]|uniref:Flagellar basal-body/hook protein C-terminal domain-containing protein n=1 Tax=Thioalkalivibrio halophilus TaxID=252474 RepID=A0A1V2ZZ73_9GAMM|nr:MULTISPECIES: hypothetical protein [Thioalkalivibrio]OOC10407.1 hypothetical protein B1A74_06340 [Thioalkalivibrio halophilus]PYG02918.1 hypothetical protein D893_01256 [Thioalkalivibrio sp. ALE21]